jgi:hypothetical protein
MKTLDLRSLLLWIATLLLAPAAIPQGKVYLVLGSDTAIWDGMDVSRYHCTYATALFTDPSGNAARVMDAGFRAELTESYGTPVKFTWWMMAGNIFRFATNTNVPHPNTMTMYLMRRYHGSAIAAWGDELSLHYHTFAWTDYNLDGQWYWNQALAFPECRDDFDVTLAELLLEDRVLPVSFRSGWHAMDNAWQQRLDSLLLYCMHNDWPAVRRDTTEPLDNTYDWSRAPKSFVPFHPSTTDYQIPGNGRGWNLRSVYMSAADSSFMDAVFAAAKQGKDQVVCLWAHLPETDFLDNVRKVNTSAHKAATRYPGTPFRYCTAVEAMQAWRDTRDTTRPVLTIGENGSGADTRWTVSSSEALFQPLPFVALKTRDGAYRTLACERTSPTTWQTIDPIPRSEVATVGTAGTDTAGNLGTAVLRYVPDDLYVEDGDAGYKELRGTWGSTATSAWGRTSRITTLGPTDTAAVRWTPPLVETGTYNIFVQAPAQSNTARDIVFRIVEHGTVVDTIRFPQGITTTGWTYLTTRTLGDTSEHVLEMWGHGSTQGTTVLAADVVKFSGLVRDRWFEAPASVDAGEIIAGDTVTFHLTLQNRGTQPLTVDGGVPGPGISLTTPLPMQIPPMSTRALTYLACFTAKGAATDSITFLSDDPLNSSRTVIIHALVSNYYRIVDDLDSLFYRETGTWSFSVAQAYGTSSRYIYPVPGASATFSTVLREAGMYDVSAIVPTTVNASTRARYLLTSGGTTADSLFRDQNDGSGSWVTLFHRILPAGAPVTIVVTDAMSPVQSGKVLRADAIRFAWVSSGVSSAGSATAQIPEQTSLDPNYPNPFNPTTMIGYRLSAAGRVNLTVYDLLGREVMVLVDEVKAPGTYLLQFDARHQGAGSLPSGTYFLRLRTSETTLTRRMLLIR